MKTRYLGAFSSFGFLVVPANRWIPKLDVASSTPAARSTSVARRISVWGDVRVVRELAFWLMHPHSAESGSQFAVRQLDSMSYSGGELRARFHDVFVQVQTAEHKASDRIEGIK
jgi:hypothetical protein